MIPKKKLYASLVTWGGVYLVFGVVFGLNFEIGVLINVFLAVIAASIALKSFVTGIALVGINSVSAMCTLYFYCNFLEGTSCRFNPFILGSFTFVMFFALWLILRLGVCMPDSVRTGK